MLKVTLWEFLLSATKSRVLIKNYIGFEIKMQYSALLGSTCVVRIVLPYLDHASA